MTNTEERAELKKFLLFALSVLGILFLFVYWASPQ